MCQLGMSERRPRESRLPGLSLSLRLPTLVVWLIWPATTEVMSGDETTLGGGPYDTDRAAYTAMVTYAARPGIDRSLGLAQALSEGVRDGLGPIAGADLREQVVDMAFHRSLADHQASGDLGVGQSPGDQ
jgi:hypothetical protein